MPFTVKRVDSESIMKRTFQTFQIDEGLHAFKVVTTIEGDSLPTAVRSIRPGKTVFTGVVDDDGLVQVENGVQNATTLSYVVADDTHLAFLRDWGWLTVPKGERKFYDGVRGDVFDALLEDPSNVDRLIRHHRDGHMCFDRHGNPIPVALPFDYINGLFSNARYDLAVALKHLRERDDIYLYDASIQAIPGYNERRGHTKTISFVWRPDAETYRKVYDRAVAIAQACNGGRFVSSSLHQAVFEVDALGLRAAGAAKYDSYWASAEDDYEIGDDDDD